MTSEVYFIVYLEKGEVMRLNNGITLFNRDEELFFVRGKQGDLLPCNGHGRFCQVISRKLLYQFIRLLKVDIFKLYVPVDVSAYIARPARGGDLVFREIIRELCVSDNNDNDDMPTMRKQFLLMALMSAFLENSSFLPLLKYILKKSMREQVIAIVTSDIGENWSVGKVAAKLYVSSSLLKKKLKDENTNYSQVVLECRMQKARELMNLRSLSVKQMAGLCGYRNVSYFIAIFKRYYGCTPCEHSTMKAPIKREK